MLGNPGLGDGQGQSLGADGDRVVFHLSIRRCPLIGKPAGGTEAEAGEGQVRGGGEGRHGEGEAVHPRDQCLIREDLFAIVGPVAVVVEVDPGVQEARDRGRDIERGDLPGSQRGSKDDAVFIVARITVVSVGQVARLAVGLAVHAGSQIYAAHDLVARTIAVQKGRIGRRGVAKVSLGWCQQPEFGSRQAVVGGEIKPSVDVGQVLGIGGTI